MFSLSLFSVPLPSTWCHLHHGDLTDLLVSPFPFSILLSYPLSLPLSLSVCLSGSIEQEKIPGSTNSSITVLHWPITPADIMEGLIGGTLFFIFLSPAHTYSIARLIVWNHNNVLICVYKGFVLYSTCSQVYMYGVCGKVAGQVDIHTRMQ